MILISETCKVVTKNNPKTMPILSTLSSTLSSSSFVLGLGIGVASTTLVSKYLYKQVRDRAQLDIEDNESGGMDIIW